jgi:hypothetical protein
MPAAFAEPYDIWPDKDNNIRRALSRHDQDDDVRGAVLSSTSSTDKQEGRRSAAFS